MGRGSQFQPPSGHCQLTSCSVIRTATGSPARPSLARAASIRPRVPALSTGDLARSGVAIGARNPVQGVPRSRDGLGLTGGYAEFHKRDHPPERAAPLRVRVAAEAAVWALTREQSTDQWTGHQVWRGVRDGVPEQVAAGQPAHRRLVGGQQPPDWVDIGNAGLRSSPRRHVTQRAVPPSVRQSCYARQIPTCPRCA